MEESTKTPNDPDQLDRLSVLVEAARIDERLKYRDAARLIQLGSAMLQNRAVWKDGRAAPLAEALAEIVCRFEGPAAAWSLIQRWDFLGPAMALFVARMQWRQHRPELALATLRKTVAAAPEAELESRLWLEIVACTRISSDSRAAEGAILEAEGRILPDHRYQLELERAFLRLRSGDLSAVADVKTLSPGSNRDRALCILWCHVYGNLQMLRRMPSPGTLAAEIGQLGAEHLKVLKLLRQVVAEPESSKGLDAARELYAVLGRLWDPEFELLALASLVSAFRRVPGQLEVARTLFDQLSQTLCKGQAGDLLELATKPAKKAVRMADSTFDQTIETVKAGASISTILVKGVFQRLASSEKDAERIRSRDLSEIVSILWQSFGAKRGCLVKVGQVTSYMPIPMNDSVRSRLQFLEDQSPPMDQDLADMVVKQELGKLPQDLFAEWNPRPFAVGSIGQVHRARMHSGEEVAVKVQFPGIEKAIRRDMKRVGLLRPLVKKYLPEVDFDAVRDDFLKTFLGECDYEAEARHFETFAKAFAGVDEIRIPKIYRSHSARRVLTMEFAKGQTLSDFAATAGPVERDRAAKALYRFLITSTEYMNTFNADPNGGNFLFEEGRVWAIDFGCIREFDPDRMSSRRRLMRAAVDSDLAVYKTEMVAQGLVRDPADFDFAAALELSRHDLRAFIKDDVYRYRREDLVENFVRHTHYNANAGKNLLPPEWLYFLRISWIFNSVLAELAADVNWVRYDNDLIRELNRIFQVEAA